jgi:hypothetical protein
VVVAAGVVTVAGAVVVVVVAGVVTVAGADVDDEVVVVLFVVESSSAKTTPVPAITMAKTTECIRVFFISNLVACPVPTAACLTQAAQR